MRRKSAPPLFGLTRYLPRSGSADTMAVGRVETPDDVAGGDKPNARADASAQQSTMRDDELRYLYGGACAPCAE